MKESWRGCVLALSCPYVGFLVLESGTSALPGLVIPRLKRRAHNESVRVTIEFIWAPKCILNQP